MLFASGALVGVGAVYCHHALLGPWFLLYGGAPFLLMGAAAGISAAYLLYLTSPRRRGYGIREFIAVLTIVSMAALYIGSSVGGEWITEVVIVGVREEEGLDHGGADGQAGAVGIHELAVAELLGMAGLKQADNIRRDVLFSWAGPGSCPTRRIIVALCNELSCPMSIKIPKRGTVLVFLGNADPKYWPNEFEPGGSLRIFGSSSGHEGYFTYRLEVNGGPSGARSFRYSH